MKVIVVGDIGSGKSTAVRAAMARMGWERPGGFFTHWAGQGRGAQTLHLETWDGEDCPIAHRVAEPVAPGGLCYALDGPTFLGAALASLLPAAAGRPVAIDELGLIELGAAEFAAAVAKLFRGPAPVLAVVQRRALDRWLEIVGRDRVDHLLDVDPATRDALPGRIAALFRG